MFSELELGATEEMSFNSKDGTQVNGLLTYPVGYAKGTRVPLLLRIHGGPNAQDQHSFSIERQMFAAHGYAVLAVNYRGSSGRGQKFSRAIFADWGNYEVQDLLAGGPPWNPRAWETYVKISYPFLHADRIRTPTLFLGGERDFNVPIEGSQQMYQALRSLGIDTQLIIYPNENHGIQRPSYQRDRMERYLAWYEKYLKKASGPSSTSTAR